MHDNVVLLSSLQTLRAVMPRRDEKEELTDYSQRKKWEEEAMV